MVKFICNCCYDVFLVETLKIVSPILIFEMGGWGYLRVFLPTKCKAMSKFLDNVPRTEPYI